MTRTTRYAADEYAEIARIAKENEAERLKNLMGNPLEEPKETPAVDDVYGMYGYPCGFDTGTADAGRLTRYALVDGKWYFTFGGENYVSDN